MTRIATETPRPYSSQLRGQQAEQTRERILDATVRVMARGLASVSIPSVAREAGVSVPTISRHFGTSATCSRRSTRAWCAGPASTTWSPRARWTSFGTVCARSSTRWDRSTTSRARPWPARPPRSCGGSACPIGWRCFRQFADSIVPKVSEVDRDRIARLVLMVTTSSSMRMWRDHLGASVDEAADDVEWMVRAAIAAASSSSRR